MLIDYTTINLLASDLDLRVRHNEMIASNIANVDTPGYKATELEFDRILDQASDSLRLLTTDSRHIATAPGGQNLPSTRESSAPGRADGNNVQIEEEMLKLTQNSIKYNISIQLLTRRLNSLKNAIAEARR